MLFTDPKENTLSESDKQVAQGHLRTSRLQRRSDFSSHLCTPPRRPSFCLARFPTEEISRAWAQSLTWPTGCASSGCEALLSPLLAPDQDSSVHFLPWTADFANHWVELSRAGPLELVKSVQGCSKYPGAVSGLTMMPHFNSNTQTPCLQIALISKTQHFHELVCKVTAHTQSLH